MGLLSDQVISLASGLSRRAAAEQGGVISGDNPVHYNAADPLRLWVIQVGIIIVFTQLLSVALSRLRQPRVIAEVIGGVVLGPSVMGHIPKFSATIFPSQSIPLLSLTANIGLVFFLFLVGLEIDTRVIKRNVRAAMSISIIGLIIPFGFGAAIAIPIYNEFITEPVNKGYFILFIAVALGITAFPVLCRILTELRLLDTTVGVVVLAAGVGNDVVGWVLLALSVALVNASSGLTALWVLLACTGYTLFLLYPVRFAFVWLARKTGSLESGQPSTLMMTVTFVMVLVSAFFTDIIGVHAIFGGFLAGLVIPHEGGFAIALVEKLEDLISILFLPIYFTLSGLNTNLSTLNTGKSWGFVVMVCVVAFLGKFIGCAVTARITGFNTRESGAIGTLMACKGLVELIVLNVGLNAKVLNTEVFSMFVVHALVLTFITTPITLLWYPAKHRTKVTAHGAEDSTPAPALEQSEDSVKTNFAVVLNRIDQLPAVMTLVNLLKRPSSSIRPLSPTSTNTNEKEKEALGGVSPLTINALRLIELSERTSDVLKSQEADTLIHRDAIVSTFRTFGHLNRIPVSTKLSVVPQEEFSWAVSDFLHHTASQMVIVPWNTGLSIPSSITPSDEHGNAVTHGASNPLDSMFAKHDLSASIAEAHLARRIFSESPADVGLYLDGGLAVADSGHGHHIFLPFFGGPDDRLALSFVVQLCSNPAVSATIVRITKVDEDISRLDSVDITKPELIHHPVSNTISAFPDTIYGQHNTQTQLASDTADNLAWARYTKPNSTHLPSVADALKRITFRELNVTRPLKATLDLVASETRETAETWKNLIVVVGRSRRMASETHHVELKLIQVEHTSIPGDVRRTFGNVASALVSGGLSTGLLVLQASMKSESV